MTTYIICTRCGKRMRPLDTVGTGTEPTIGYCACKPQTGWGYPAPMTPLLDWRDAELARLRAELEKEKARSARIMADFRKVLRWDGHGQFFSKVVLDARIAERDKLRAELEHARNSLARTIDTCNAWSDKYVERNTEAIALRAALAEAERERDEARAKIERGNRMNTQELERDLAKLREIRARIHAASPSDELEQLRKEIDGGYELFLWALRNHIELVAENNKLFNSRETIDRLVIAFRVCLRWVAWNTKTVADIRRLVNAERGQAGKE